MVVSNLGCVVFLSKYYLRQNNTVVIRYPAAIAKGKGCLWNGMFFTVKTPRQTGSQPSDFTSIVDSLMLRSI